MKKFSLRARGQSFKYAFDGLAQFFRGEHNALLHLLATLLVIILAIILQVSKWEVIVLVIVTGSVWAAELFNTAIEKIMDFISVKEHPGIKFIKDISAAAVLVTALVALIAGCIIFIPKF
jgi:diacylglycerol kinase (ATP)